MLIGWLAFLTVFAAIGTVALPATLRFLLQHGMIAENYRGRKVANGLGLYLWIMLLVYYAMLQAWPLLGRVHPAFDQAGCCALPAALRLAPSSRLFDVYTLAVTVVFFIGWLDDTIGDKSVKGLKGHLNKWKEEKIVTSGIVKAAGISAVALCTVVGLGNDLPLAIVQFFILALMTNSMNLLDLRPGRALKAFFLFALLLPAAGTFRDYAVFLLPVATGALLLFAKDVRAAAMLGDAGANFIGFSLAFCIVISTPPWLQTMLLALLALLHWTAERSSITRVIENNRLLNWFDRLGRT